MSAFLRGAAVTQGCLVQAYRGQHLARNSRYAEVRAQAHSTGAVLVVLAADLRLVLISCRVIIRLNRLLECRLFKSELDALLYLTALATF